MISTTVAIHVITLTLSASGTAILAGYAWGRTKQGTVPFVALMVVFTIYSAAHMIGLLTVNPTWRIIWENVQWIGTAFIPAFWMLFAMEYTGLDGTINRQTVGALSVVPAVTILLTWTNPWHGLVWTHNVVASVDGLAIVDQQFGPWFWVFIAYTYGLLAIGSFLLMRLVWISDYLYTDQSVLLVFGVATPVIANVLTIMGVTPIRNPPLDMTPYSFTITGLAFGYALFRHRLFDLVPATRQLGRNAAISQLDDGIVIVDAARQIVYLNQTATEHLQCEIEAALGRPITALVEESSLQFDVEEALAELERDGRVYEMRTSPIYDRHDRLIGHTLIVHDVTARKERERRVARQRDELALLNELNGVIRDVNSALIAARTRAENRGGRLRAAGELLALPGGAGGRRPDLAGRRGPLDGRRDGRPARPGGRSRLPRGVARPQGTRRIREGRRGGRRSNRLDRRPDRVRTDGVRRTRGDHGPRRGRRARTRRPRGTRRTRRARDQRRREPPPAHGGVDRRTRTGEHRRRPACRGDRGDRGATRTDRVRPRL
ncbi:MAG: histidine kinase N-terminal 7TM domain-containing protein [Salinigranum sp.]